MKVGKDEMARSRTKILKAAARLFRKRGFEDVTVSEVMRRAGLTHGAFYSYFSSKNDLIARALEASVDTMSARSAPSIGEYAARYLTAEHRQNITEGCVFAALGCEAARSRSEFREVLTAGLKTQIAKLVECADGASSDAKRQTAITSWAAMVGALMLSRLSNDEALSDEILERTERALTR